MGLFPSCTVPTHPEKFSILFHSTVLSICVCIGHCMLAKTYIPLRGTCALSLQIKFAFSLKIHGVIHPSDGVWKILPNSHNPFLYFHFLDHYVTLSFLSMNSLI